MFDVVAMGELLIDFTPAGASDAGNLLFERNPGGAPANVLAVVSKYGGRCAFIGKVGADMFGDFLRGKLQELSIDCSNLVSDPDHNTTLAFVSIDQNGDRSFSFYRDPGADTCLTADEVDTELIRQCRIFHFGTLSMTREPARSATFKALETAKSFGRIISFDPNYRPLLWKDEGQAIRAMKDGLSCADIAKLSLEEAQMVTGKKDPEDCAKLIISQGLSLVAVTMGADGCVYAAGDYCGALPGYPAKTVDTTGAGDTFWGTVLFELIKRGIDTHADMSGLPEDELSVIMLTASIAAGMSTEKKGAIPSIPDYSRVIEALNRS